MNVNSFVWYVQFNNAQFIKIILLIKRQRLIKSRKPILENCDPEWIAQYSVKEKSKTLLLDCSFNVSPGAVAWMEATGPGVSLFLAS